MPTLIYAPGVKAAISTREQGILDISDDLVRGSMTLNENAVSTFNFQLANHRRKYDRVFTPNDRIIVQLRRIGPYLQCFSGYLDTVPYFSIYPRTVRLAASCTLKRLRYRLWDAGASASYSLISSSTTGTSTEFTDVSVKTKVVDLLTKVADWPGEQIHIGAVPAQWFTKVADLYAKVGPRLEIAQNMIGGGATIMGDDIPQAPGSVATASRGILSPSDFYALMKSRGAIDYEAIALGGTAATESGFNTNAIQGGGKGRGLFQIDLGQHPDISEGQALDPFFATDWALKAIRARGSQKSAEDAIRAAGPTLFYGPRDRPTKAAEGRALIAAVAGKITQTKATSTIVSLAPTTTPGASPTATGAASPTVSSAEGIRFVSAENLKANVFAAKQFVERMWPEMKGNIGGYAPGTGHAKNSDHYVGLALDLAVSRGPAQGRERQLGNSMALWFAQNPNVFGTKYVIWQGEMLDKRSPGAGWFKADDHYDHVHVSFENTGQTAPGPMGGGNVAPWNKATVDHFTGGFVSGVLPGGDPGSGTGTGFGGGTTDGLSSPVSPLNVFNWTGGISDESETLYGVRALMNDDPILDTIAILMGVSMRSYMAAPNGDFIGWFPDYFGLYGTAGKMIIQDIELEDFTMVWDDSRLITHQYTAGAPYNDQEALGAGGIVDQYQKYLTAGIVSVEFPEVMEALLNVKPGEGAFGDAAKIFARFGARKSYEAMGTITGAEAEFWYAVHLFQRNWAEQFSAMIPTTFMPELFPGMLIQLPNYGFQCYVTSVTHEFDFSQGAGFSTAATVIAPSSTSGGGIYGLPKSL